MYCISKRTVFGIFFLLFFVFEKSMLLRRGCVFEVICIHIVLLVYLSFSITPLFMFNARNVMFFFQVMLLITSHHLCNSYRYRYFTFLQKCIDITNITCIEITINLQAYIGNDYISYDWKIPKRDKNNMETKMKKKPQS